MLPSWIMLALVSALLLGVYDAAKKSSVKDNSVPAVLMAAVSISASIWVLLLVAQFSMGDAWPADVVRVEPIGWQLHLALLAKSLIVGVSWSLAYYAIQILPLSIAGPIRAMGPAWTIALAILFLGERPVMFQWIGIALVLIGFFAMSRVGRREGIVFQHDRGVWIMLIATLVGACSGLYDKVLLQRLGITVPTVQAWFSIYLVPVIMPLWLHWWIKNRASRPFQWRWTIAAIAVFLLAADFIYFAALRDPDAMVSIVSPIRRLSAIVSFVIAAIHFGDKNIRAKSLCVGMIMSGILVIGWASR